MKTERRHELRTNELGAFLLDVNDWAKKHAYQLGGGMIVLALAVLVVRNVQGSRAHTSDAALTTMFDLAFTPEDQAASFETLERLINEATDPYVRRKALLRKGLAATDLAMRSGQFQPEYLNQAEQAYEELRRAYPDCMPVVAMALGALANIEENRFVADQDLKHRDAARAYLTQLQDDPQFRGTPFQTDAAQRLRELEGVFQVIVLAEPLPLPPAPEPGPAAQSPGITITPVDGTQGSIEIIPAGAPVTTASEPSAPLPSPPDPAGSPDDEPAEQTEPGSADADDTGQVDEDDTTPTP